MTDQALKSKTALVTGASNGISRAIAMRMARDGASVAVHGRDMPGANEVVETIKAAGGSTFTINAELGSTNEIQRAFPRP